MADQLYYIDEAVRSANAGSFRMLLVNLFGRRQVIEQCDAVVTLALYRGERYFLDRVRKP